MKNIGLRVKARNANVFLWEIAQVLGLNDGNFSRMLRKELSIEQVEEINNIIDNLKKSKLEKGGIPS